jgi:hypothetical protein
LKFSLNQVLASSDSEVELISLISKNLPPSQFSYAEGWRIVAAKKAQFMKLCAVIRIINCNAFAGKRPDYTKPAITVRVIKSQVLRTGNCQGVINDT